MDNLIRGYFLDGVPRDTVLVVPGGGYAYHSQREAGPVARMFNREGYHAAVFEYRHQLQKYPEIVDEAKRLIGEFIDKSPIKRLFIIGFSAGGHLALMLLEKYPDWFSGGILAYPVISTKPGLIHEQSFFNLYGRIPEPAELDEVSLEDHIPDKLPPLFIWHTLTDASVAVGNSLVLLEALADKKKSVEAHLYPSGEHGLSIITKETVPSGIDSETYVRSNSHVATWVKAMFQWLRTL